MKKARRNYSPQEKVEILRSHLVDKVSTSQICAEFQLQPKIFYGWMKQLFDNGPGALKRRPTVGKRLDASRHDSTGPQEQLMTCESREAELNWMISLAQGRFGIEEIKLAISNRLDEGDVDELLACIRTAPLKYRNRAVAVLSYYHLIRVGHIAEFLRVTHSSVDEWLHKFPRQGCQLLLPWQSHYRKAKDTVYRDAIFEILHAPPSAYGINRTTWRLPDLHTVMAKRGLPIARTNIRKIIKDAGYRYRKAKKVLTSNDPKYKEKLKNITCILHNLAQRKSFFRLMSMDPSQLRYTVGGPWCQSVILGPCRNINGARAG